MGKKRRACHGRPAGHKIKAMEQPRQTSSVQTICARCHLAGDGCCRIADDRRGGVFGLTRGEIELMAQASGLAPEAFVEADQAKAAFVAGVNKIHPILGQTMPGGRRLRLRLQADGSCYFLGPAGCQLPVAARPIYCRLYPFWFTPGGRLMVLGSRTCLAQQGARRVSEVLARLGQNEADLRRLFRRLEEFVAGHQPEAYDSSSPGHGA
ncbi:hypothetical protein Deba_0854 [Desulfarculus baarsii DSM 2075]|uniref:YkgJ family cysteine cluster protein n=1 Tax=Desulfarculus baarsii (strain ATCC 33931 / DSM 2075 / LMG 7858 / VKM B-1802 / 2st14) TaxID=644282 RepID=E1QF88_DESB2|nr:hypothetical protein [Desulfarculus baarsii]ADK84224.1 hypothetical protein Deba_0854 [Desulfarculus baarsii DSM 2075]